MAGTGRRRAPNAAGSPKSLVLVLCLLWAKGREAEEWAKAALLRPHLNAISLKAFFLSSEGAGSRQHNCGLCMMVNSLCLEKSMRKVCLCVQRSDVVPRQNHLEVIKVPTCRGC